ncbi:hypothetical protein SV7mr_10050 [Stieleria bergensis]|uniref:Uncharacterized protein n=1 Tax=Stieleria bergensis TaxID=2528025 RepID=A0A517SQU8_9BACT|nr:hypothetical protein SV7mr_10050 [Planctomycetes bacterium SV_7m_r]
MLSDMAHRNLKMRLHDKACLQSVVKVMAAFRRKTVRDDTILFDLDVATVGNVNSSPCHPG